MNQVSRARSTSVKLDQSRVDFATGLVCDSDQERLLHFRTRSIEVLAMTIHLEGTVQEDNISPLALLRRDLCKAGDGSERLKIVQSVDSQVILNMWKLIRSKSSNVEPYLPLRRAIDGYVAVC